MVWVVIMLLRHCDDQCTPPRSRKSDDEDHEDEHRGRDQTGRKASKVAERRQVEAGERLHVIEAQTSG